MRWGRQFTSYLKEKGLRDSVFWTVAFSGDTHALFEDDCTTIVWPKYKILKEYWGETGKERKLLRGPYF
jgi:hypothetical protein